MAYRSSRSDVGDWDYGHRRAPVREYEDDRSVVDRTPAFLREDVRRTEAGPLVLRSREVETVDRRRPRSPSPQVRYRERFVDRERDRAPSPLPERRPVRFARSPSPPASRIQVVERVERRQRERSPTPERERDREMFHLHIEHEKRKERAPSPSPSPSPPPQQAPVIRGPTIEREVITHYRDIDHGVVRAKPPTPPPQPRRAPSRAPSRARSRAREHETDIDIDISRHETDIDIRQRTRSRSRPRERPRPQARPSYDDDDLIIVRNRDKLKVSDTTRRRAHSAAPRPEWDEEAEYITSKIDARGRMGEAKHGATKDWTIIDVPPGTERVKMDGVGGGGAEVTWQRYNGVRRSKFIPDREDSPSQAPSEPGPDTSRDRLSVQIYDSKHHDRELEVEEVRDRRISIHGERRSRKREGMWTEMTKDLVNREAIERLGYEYEETEYFFYIMQYLRYEDVLELVDVTDEIRRRRRRAREYEEHDHHMFSRRNHHRHDDERIVEREVVFDSSRYLR
ncbi:putative glutamic acid rich protein [Rosellinia necatrix]|uniref:Putative glutamic acid rich protein n=1 Tax=Rosellinia necatrix TaxID=77044 RepID=A0A1S7UMB2_ROSNE|nr:putative glutamic acid rich protein [Rosellinia necatrix]